MRPQITIDQCLDIIKANNIDRNRDKCVLIGIRAYYLDSMGLKGANDRGIYDDALIWVTPSGYFAVQANTDPSSYRKGSGSGSKKGMASLNPGVWRYKPGIHYGSVQHEAFRQAAPVRITRDGVNGPYQDILNESINIHMGGANGTSSLGCQTTPRDTWKSFKEFGYAELKRYGQKDFPYILIEETARRKGALKVSV